MGKGRIINMTNDNIILECKSCGASDEVDALTVSLPYIFLNKQRFLCKDCLKIYFQSKKITSKMRE